MIIMLPKRILLKLLVQTTTLSNSEYRKNKIYVHEIQNRHLFS